MEKNKNSLNQIFAAIDGLLKEKESIIIGIDGRCGAGKTTLAKQLANQYNANIIAMDDFFLPITLRTEARRKEAGGNVHYERFYEEVVKHIKTGKSFVYQKFDCSKMDFGDKIIINPKRVTIIEGTYSFRPEFLSLYDLKIVKWISKEEQRKRILERNGEEKLYDFETLWIPMEEAYFNRYHIRETADVLING